MMGQDWTSAIMKPFHHLDDTLRAPSAVVLHARGHAGISSLPFFTSFTHFHYDFFEAETIRVVCITLIMRPLLYGDSPYYSNINSVVIEIREFKFW